MRPGWIVWALALVCCWTVRSELLLAQNQSLIYGPYHGEFPAGGEGLAKDLPGQASTTLLASTPDG